MSGPDDLGDALDRLHEAAFGSPRGVLRSEGVCVRCKQLPTFSTDAGRREFAISGLCEPCFDSLFEGED